MKFYRRRPLWIVLFIVLASLLSLLATSWNVVLVQDSLKIIRLSQGMPWNQIQWDLRHLPWIKLVAGTLGFVLILVGTILFFIRLLKEMKLNQLQTEFLAKISHELKSPLTTLDLTSSLLKVKTLPNSGPEEAELWALHDAELSRLKAEVDVLLQTARLEYQPLKPELEQVSLEKWLDSSISRWQKVFGKSQIIRTGHSLQGEVRLDLKFLDLIANNLVDNARKFAIGEPKLVIRTEIIPSKSRNGPKCWEIGFEDFGWGFDSKISGKIFRRFYRGKSKAPYAITGTGLGLYLAASACKTMGLQLRGKSNGPEQGATFVLRGKMGISND